MKELEPFQKFEMVDSLAEKFLCRLRIEDAMKELREIKAKLDEDLIFCMKEQGVKKFLTGPEGNQSEIRYGNKAKHTINAKAVRDMLLSKEPAERTLTYRALGLNQSAWSNVKVREMQDTLGRTDLMQTTYKDEIEVKVKPVDMLKNMGRE